MKIEGLAVDSDGVVTASFRFPDAREPSKAVLRFLQLVEAGAETLHKEAGSGGFGSTAAAAVLGYGTAPVSRDPDPQREPGEAPSHTAEQEVVVEAPTGSEPRRRRRHQNPLEPQEAAAAGAESPTGQGQPAETEVSPRRRRRASVESDPSNSAASTAEPGESVENPPRRRRRTSDASLGAGTAAAAGEAGASASATPEEPRRRRRSAGAVEIISQTGVEAVEEDLASNDKISDADLSKACSEAARVLTPKVVMEYLATFGVKQAGQLHASERRRFLDGLKAKKEAA